MLIQVLEGVTKVVKHEVLCGDGLHQVQQVDTHGHDLRLGVDPDTWFRVKESDCVCTDMASLAMNHTFNRQIFSGGGC